MTLDYCKVMAAVLIHRGWISFLSAFSLIWLKNQGVAKQRLVCNGHPPVVGVHLGCACAHQRFQHHTPNRSPSPLQLGCKPGLSKAHPAAFTNGRLFESLTLNISVSHRC